jgi:hypothetical protein
MTRLSLLLTVLVAAPVLAATPIPFESPDGTLTMFATADTLRASASVKGDCAAATDAALESLQAKADKLGLDQLLRVVEDGSPTWETDTLSCTTRGSKSSATLLGLAAQTGSGFPAYEADRVVEIALEAAVDPAPGGKFGDVTFQLRDGEFFLQLQRAGIFRWEYEGANTQRVDVWGRASFEFGETLERAERIEEAAGVVLTYRRMQNALVTAEWFHFFVPMEPARAFLNAEIREAELLREVALLQYYPKQTPKLETVWIP